MKTLVGATITLLCFLVCLPASAITSSKHNVTHHKAGASRNPKVTRAHTTRRSKSSINHANAVEHAAERSHAGLRTASYHPVAEPQSSSSSTASSSSTTSTHASSKKSRCQKETFFAPRAFADGSHSGSDLGNSVSPGSGRILQGRPHWKMGRRHRGCAPEISIRERAGFQREAGCADVAEAWAWLRRGRLLDAQGNCGA